MRDALDRTPGQQLTAAEVAELTTLFSVGRGIADLSGLEHCTNLTFIDLSANQISDISVLSSLTKLTSLNLNGNQITDISALSSLTNLTVLYLDGNQISDISALSSPINLSVLRLEENKIGAISPLVENAGLGSGDEVWLTVNNLDLREGSEDVEDIRALKDRGVVVRHDPLQKAP